MEFNGYLVSIITYQSSWTKSIFRCKSEFERCDSIVFFWMVFNERFRCKILFGIHPGDVTLGGVIGYCLISKATFLLHFGFNKPLVVSANTTVVASLGPSVKLETSYWRIELNWLRPNKLPAIDDVLLDPFATCDHGGPSQGLCKLVNEVSRQTFCDAVGVTTDINGLCGRWLSNDWSTISDVIDELAFEDCLWGFLGPNVVITLK